MSLSGALESLLFVAGDDGLAPADMAALLGVDQAEVVRLLEKLQQRYEADDKSGLQLMHFARRYQLVTKAKYVELVKQYAISPLATKLSQAALETLAIVAYKQPLTRSAIDEIRGVNSGGSLQKLLLRDLVEEKGREQSPGRPILYGTTDYFMNYFGIADLSQLPDISEMLTASQDELKDLFAERYERIEALAQEQASREAASQEDADSTADEEA